MKEYVQLSLEEREELYALQKVGWSLGRIGEKLGRNKGSLSRELHRNAKYGQTYIPCRAQAKADRRKLKQRRKAPLKNSTVYLYVREHLRMDWSPETIAGRLPLDYPQESVCTETIYQYIYQKDWYVKREKLWRYLTLRRKKRMEKLGRRVRREGRIPEAVSIDLRPEYIANRDSIGHWETDNVIGKQTDDTVLSVSVERKTRLTIMSLVERSASSKTKALFTRFSLLPEVLRQTITTDNGKENTYHQQITKSLGMPVYFCHAYCSWEKGGVENMNGRIRHFLPKGESMDLLNTRIIQGIEWKLNTTPRKCLSWKMPLEVLEEILHTDQTTNRCTSS